MIFLLLLSRGQRSGITKAMMPPSLPSKIWLLAGLGVLFRCEWVQAQVQREAGVSQPVVSLAEHGLSVRGMVLAPISDAQDAVPGNDGLRSYGTTYSERALEDLRNLGANWVSVSVYGYLSDQCDTSISPGHEKPAEVLALLRQIEDAGMSVLISPTLWVEDPAGWRGRLGQCPEGGSWSDVDWTSFWSSYQSFITGWAALAQEGGVQGFSVGLEMVSSTARATTPWASLIASVREDFEGWTTYSANWDEASQVPFWDLLDAIGVNAFYPLSEEGGPDDIETLRSAASSVADSLRALSVASERPVLFTEVGYKSHAGATIRPWEWPEDIDGNSLDEALQARAYQAVLETFWEESWFVGGFWWKTFTDPDDATQNRFEPQEPPYGFSPLGKQAEDVLRDAFLDLAQTQERG